MRETPWRSRSGPINGALPWKRSTRSSSPAAGGSAAPCWRGGPAAERKRRAHELLRKVGLEGFEDLYPHELSGGMRKRGSLVRTLLADDPVILMDEPFGPLDAQTRLLMQDELLRLWQGTGK